jgi:hypothetical protein
MVKRKNNRWRKFLSVLLNDAVNRCVYIANEWLRMQHQWNYTNNGKPKHSKKTLSQCHFVQNKSHKDWPGIEPGPPGWDADGQPHEQWLGKEGFCSNEITQNLWFLWWWTFKIHRFLDRDNKYIRRYLPVFRWNHPHPPHIHDIDGAAVLSETSVPTYKRTWFNDLETGMIKAIAIYATAWGPTLWDRTKMRLYFIWFVKYILSTKANINLTALSVQNYTCLWPGILFLHWV